jgi:hypothetical protein
MDPMTRNTSVFALVCFLWLLIYVKPLGAEPMGRSAELGAQAANAPLLDQYPDAYAAYSLRKLRSDYSGPAIRVRRSSDGAEQDIGFTSSGSLDTNALTSFVGSGEGEVVKWYSQVEGEANLTPGGQGPPLIVQDGSVVTTEEGKPILYFPPGTILSSYLNASFPRDDFSFLVVLDLDETLGWYAQRRFLWFKGTGLKHGSGTSLFAGPYGDLWNDDGVVGKEDTFIAGHSNGLNERSVYIDNGEAVRVTDGTNGTQSLNSIRIGYNANTASNRFTGRVGEVIVYPQVSKSEYFNRYDGLNSYWSVGPTDYNPEAILPQTFEYQVTLYNWLETISEADVVIPTGKTFTYDNSYANKDELADLWLATQGLSGSSVVRGEPEWWVLDAGNGKGIEATEEVRLWYEPEGGGGGGNPPRSWENEPAYLYQMDIPLSGGGQGNPYYKMPELGRRAMISAMVDLMMHHSHIKKGSSGWFDMVGKSFLGMAEAYRWSGEVLPPDVQQAFEKGMEYVLDHQIAQGPRAVNTNMDMFMLHGAADLYMATDDPTIKKKCVQVVKRALFGYKDGMLETNHKVFAAGTDDDGGVLSSAGFIMEGDQPEVFYGGESMFHLMGAYTAVMDRSDGSVPSDWQFLEEVLRRIQEWRTYQYFYNPNPNYFGVGSGAGFSSRTSAPVPSEQADHDWKRLSWASIFDEGTWRVRNEWRGTVNDQTLPPAWKMENDISNKMSHMTGKMSSLYNDQPDTWSGWSPWTKPTPYLPPEGWYSRLDSLVQNDDPLTYAPSEREEYYYDKTFGGLPLGKSWWAYKDTDGTQNWGFFVEAMPRQGGYAGYYGGKVETFWTEEAGYVLVNRHEKSGSNGWSNLESKAAHHVWGRDENGNGFSTIWLRGRDLGRTVTFNTDASPPAVSVTNPFNDSGAGEPGEETDGTLEEDVEITNQFEALSDGVRVTHTVTSDQTDQVTELWASLPFFRKEDNLEVGMNRATLDYWDGSSWQDIPEDTDSDGVPELVTTTVIRFTRDTGSASGRVYVAFPQSETIRLSTQAFRDDYQTDAKVRTAHIDLHGNPGTTKTLPAEKSISYTIQTTDPTSEEDASTSQVIPLQKGWNIVSTSVSPNAPVMDSIFAELQSEIMVVKNEAKEEYRPDENINEIGQWNSEEAYRVYAESDVTLTILGDSLGSPSIELEEGQNLVPYFPSSPLSVEEAVSSITEKLVRVRDETGRAYSPERDPDILEQMEPGEGYKVYVRQSTTLTYPDGGN